MTSTAISGQGAILSLATGSGGAKTITAVQVGYPTILTAAAHGFSNGDVVALAALAGADAALLNGQTAVVQNKTTNTWAVNIDTTGKTITAGSGTATPSTFTVIGNVHNINHDGGARTVLKATNLGSSYAEKLAGLLDNGAVSVDFDVDNNDAGLSATRAKYIAGTLASFKLVMPGAVANLTYTWTAVIKKFSVQVAEDAIVKGAMDLDVSGVVTLA